MNAQKLITAVFLFCVCGCATPNADSFGYAPTEARKCFAGALVQMKRNPATAPEFFDLARISKQLSKSQGKVVTEDQVATELINFVTRHEDDLPKLLPASLMAVSEYTAMTDGTYIMKSNVPLVTSSPDQFLVTFSPVKGSCRIVDIITDGWRWSGQLAGAIFVDDDLFYP